jgi:hypothetical protein
LTRVNPSLATAVVAAIGLAAPAFGSTIAQIEGMPTGTAVTFGYTAAATPPGTDPSAEVTAIGSVAGITLDGYTYTNWAFLANDGTGSLEVFGHMPAGGYIPTLGDTISASGTYDPFNNIPEVSTLTAISKLSGGNAVPAPVTVTIPTMNALTMSPTSNSSIQEYLLALNNVSILQETPTDPVPGSFPTHANGTYTLSDGTNTMTMFQYASSYSAAGALGGTPIPTGLVDLTGIVDVFSTGPEFIPFSVTAVPEPASIGLLAMGGLMLLKRWARNA